MNYRIPLLLFIYVLTSPAAKAAEPEILDCTHYAVIPRKNYPILQNLADLLQIQMSSQHNLTVLERAEFENILSEQELNAAFAADGVASRVRLGQLFNADILVMLDLFENRNKQGKGKESVLCASVVDTARGLRLVREYRSIDQEEPGRLCDSLIEPIIRANQRRMAKDMRIIAVSPFQSRDVSLEYSEYRNAMAKLLEETLLELTETVVVEFDEAEALSREMSIAGQHIQREMPLYIYGSYKTSRQDDKVRFDYKLELRKGLEVLGTYDEIKVDSEDIAVQFVEALDILLGCINHDPVDQELSLPETEMLLSRAKLFQAISDWESAICLYQAALLIHPGNMDALTGLFSVYTFMMKSGGGRQAPEWWPYDPEGRVHYGDKALGVFREILASGEPTIEALNIHSTYSNDYDLIQYMDNVDYAAVEDKYCKSLRKHGNVPQ